MKDDKPQMPPVPASPKQSSSDYRPESRMIHGRMVSPHWSFADPIVPPISASTSYRLESAGRGANGFQAFAHPELNRLDEAPIYIYDRLDEPCRGMLEDNLAQAEGGETAVAFATGMAAISASLMGVLRAGDTLVSHQTIYGCTWSLFNYWLPRIGIQVKFVDLNHPTELAELLEKDPTIAAVYTETPCNPSLELIDLQALAASAATAGEKHGRKVYTIVDNTFATPYCQRPIEHGIDIVVHSLTKNIGGFGTEMGGVVVGPKTLEQDLLLYRKDFGAALGSQAAWSILVHGLPTLAVRARQQMETAAKVAQFLENHPEINQVSYPGLESHPQHELAKRQMVDFDGNFAPGGMIWFTLRGDDEVAQQRGVRMMNHLADHALTVTLAVSLGQIKTLIEHPSSMTHAPIPPDRQRLAGIEPGGVRLSIGLEPAVDILRDLEAALEAHVDAEQHTEVQTV